MRGQVSSQVDQERLGPFCSIHEDHWPLNTTLYVKEFRRASPAYALHPASTP